jgi:hypothetical protein
MKADGPGDSAGVSRGHGFCRRPVSRILSGLSSRTIIPLGDALPRRSSNLPAGFGSCFRARNALHLVAPGRYALPPKRSLQSLPIWSCSVWGLPCVPAYAETGALLPHLFTLTSGGLHGLGMKLRPSVRRRYIFCCTGRLCALKRKSRTLSGTLPCGVRTFLPRQTSLRMKTAAIAQPPAFLSLSHGGFRGRINQIEARQAHGFDVEGEGRVAACPCAERADESIGKSAVAGF